jgi:ABC-type sugar transport system permease subunit
MFDLADLGTEGPGRTDQRPELAERPRQGSVLARAGSVVVGALVAIRTGVVVLETFVKVPAVFRTVAFIPDVFSEVFAETPLFIGMLDLEGWGGLEKATGNPGLALAVGSRRDFPRRLILLRVFLCELGFGRRGFSSLDWSLLAL